MPSIAIFKDHSAAERAVDELIAGGVEQKSISLIVSEETKLKHFSSKIQRVAVDEEAPSGPPPEEILPRAGWLALMASGLGAGGVSLGPGIGLMATGPALAALTASPSIAEAGRTGSELTAIELLSSKGVSPENATRFTDDVKGGAVVIAVDDSGNSDFVLDVFRRNTGWVIS